jgi:hypothetical protein
MKDLYLAFAETLGKFTPAQSKEFAAKRQEVMESTRTILGIEIQLNMAEAILGSPITKHVVKNNGAQTESFTEGFEGGGDPISEDKQLLIKSYMMTCNISEALARTALNLPPSEIAKLGRHVVADWYHFKAGGMSEADCITQAKKGRGHDF